MKELSASELRIGNIVQTLYGILSVHAAMLVDINAKAITAFPLLLTDETIESLGFKKVDKMQFGGHKYAWRIHFDNPDKHWIDLNPSYVMLYESGRVYIQYIHQLQNLFFAITNMELNLDGMVMPL